MTTRSPSLWRSGGFWRAQRPAARAKILGAVFFTFSVLGFVTDIWSLNPDRPRWQALLGALYTGSIAVGFVYAIMSRRRAVLAVMIALQILGSTLIPKLLPSTSAPNTSRMIDARRLQRQLTFDGLGLIVVMALGYALFMAYIRGDGERHIRLSTEVALAKDIHDRIAPPIQTRIGRLEFYGRALPSSEISGDLLDLVDAPSGPVVYVADVAGHGIAAGTVASMVKSAVRMGLLRTPRLEEVLADLNRLIRDLDRPDLFATCAGIEFAGSGTASVTLAGHPPVLVVAAGGGSVRRIHNAHPPLGVVEADGLRAESVTFAAGDLFVLFTDGITEVTNEAGAELGEDGIERTVREHASQPLEAIAAAVFDAARRHGAQQDDQTLLLVRALA